MGILCVFKPKTLAIGVLGLMVFGGSCSTQKSNFSKPSPGPTSEQAPNTFRAEESLEAEKGEEEGQPPFVYFLPESWNPSFRGDFSMAARKLLSTTEELRVTPGDPSVFAVMISFFLDSQRLEVINIIATAHTDNGFKDLQYFRVLKVDNGCRRLIDTGWVQPGHPLFPTLSLCGSVPDHPLVNFPFYNSNGPTFGPGSIYAAVGATPEDQNAALIANAADPFHGIQGQAYTGVVEVMSIDPYSVPQLPTVMDAYAESVLWPHGDTPAGQACREAILNHPNFVMLQFNLVQFKEEEGPDLTPPYSPMLCSSKEDIVNIGKNRLRNGCKHPTQVCGANRVLGKCKDFDIPQNYFKEVEFFEEAAFVVPAMMVKRSRYKQHTDVWFATELNALTVPECQASHGI
jgi:hypothetical protein